MAISVTDPINRAISRAKWITFQPFDLGKWFVLGFCAFLATLGEGGGFNFNSVGNWGGGSGTPGPGGGTSSANPFDTAMTWISSHYAAVALIITALVLVTLSIVLVLIWISSRGTFMFIDGIAKNTAAVIAPWKQYRRLGNSLFRFRIGISAVYIVAMLVILGLSLVLAWGDIQSRTFGGGAIWAIVVGIVLSVPTLIVLGLINWSVGTFVTVIMYARDTTVGPAWREFRSNILAGNVGSLILFLLMQIVLAVACGVMQMLLGCLTLCIGLLPYLSSVVSLPLLIFIRAYPIYFLEQFGPQYVVMTEPPPKDFGFAVIMPPPPVG